MLMWSNMVGLVLKNCAYVLTQNDKRDVLRNCDILVEDGRIVSISKASTRMDYKDHEVVDCKNKIVMSSLINAHTHAPMSLLRGYRDDDELSTWLNAVWKVEKKMSKSDVFAGALFSCMEMIKTGTSCFVDMYFYMEEVMKAAEKAGMRAFLGYGIMDEDKAVDGKMVFSKTERFVKRMKNVKNELVNAVVAPHSIYTCSEELIMKAKELANEHGLLFTMHLAETRWEVWNSIKEHGLRPAELLEKIGVVDDKSIFFHASWLTKGEIRLLAKNKASVVHCPVSNMKLATGGAFPYREMKEAGVKAALGTDGACSNNSLNMFNEMKAAALLQKWFRWNAKEMVAQQALDMATIAPASMLKLNAGSIEAGKYADIILLDANHYSMLPHSSIVSNIVYSANPEAITDVIINGKFVMRDKTILTLDEEKVKEKFMKRVERLIA